MNIKPKMMQAVIRSKSEIILIKLKDAPEKSLIFQNCHKLKNFKTKLSISDHLSLEELEIKRKMLTTKESEIVGGDPAVISKDISQKFAYEKMEVSLENKKESRDNHFVTKHEFAEDDYIKSLFKTLKDGIDRKVKRKKLLGLLARVAVRKEAVKPVCTCGTKDSTAEHATYISTKAIGLEATWLFRRLKKTRKNISNH